MTPLLDYSDVWLIGGCRARTFFLGHRLVRLITAAHTDDDAEREAGEPHARSAHADQGQGLAGNGYQVHGNGHVHQRL